MISFVNAKINIGLQIVGRREDGYHNLQTFFYPVGLYAGTPVNPVSFCDILEIRETSENKTGDEKFRINFSGRELNCPMEKNLVYKASKLYFDTYVEDSFRAEIYLEKHLPDQAGMGGGSADAGFTLRLLRDLHAEFVKHNVEGSKKDKLTVSDDELCRLALKLGADCPFFIYNRPAFATGIGEKLQPIDLDLSGLWLLVVKPNVSISTREAFAGVSPAQSDVDLRTIRRDNISEWKQFVKNDFEASFFAKYPEMAEIKSMFYDKGALYASMTGSGSCFYAIFEKFEKAYKASKDFEVIPTISATYLLKL